MRSRPVRALVVRAVVTLMIVTVRRLRVGLMIRYYPLNLRGWDVVVHQSPRREAPFGETFPVVVLARALVSILTLEARIKHFNAARAEGNLLVWRYYFTAPIADTSVLVQMMDHQRSALVTAWG